MHRHTHTLISGKFLGLMAISVGLLCCIYSEQQNGSIIVKHQYFHTKIKNCIKMFGFLLIQ